MASNDKPVQVSDDEAQRLCHLLQQYIDASRAATAVHMENIERWRRYLWDSDPADVPMFEGGSTLSSPFVKESIFALQAEIGPALLNVDPIAHVEGYGESKAWGDELESLYQLLYGREIKQGQQSFTEIMLAWLYGSLRDGAYLCETTWDERIEYRWQQLQDADGTWYTDYAPDVVYDLPRYDLIPPDRFGTFPAHASDIQEAAGLWVRKTVRADSLLAGRGKYYDADAVDELLQVHPDVSEQETPADTQFGVSAAQVPVQESDDERSQTITLTEVHYRYKPGQNWLIIMEESQNVVLRCVPLPWWHGVRPYTLLRPYTVIEGIYGDSLASAGAGHIQEFKQSGERLAFDMAMRKVNPRYIVPASQYEELNKTKNKGEFSKPGAMMPVADEFIHQGYRLEPFDTGADPTSMLPLLQYADQSGQRAVGVNDTMKGAPVAGDSTATEIASMIEGQKKIIGAITEAAARAYGEVFTQTHGLIKQFQSRDSVQALWAEVMQDKEVGEIADLQEVLDGQYTITANGISETSNKAVRAKRALEMVTILKEEPNVWGDPKLRHAALSYYLQNIGLRNPADFMGTAEEWQQRELQAAQMQYQQADAQIKEIEGEMAANPNEDVMQAMEGMGG